MIRKFSLHTVMFLSFLAVSLVLPQYVKAQDEKSIILKSMYFGDFRQSKKIKKQGRETLSVWDAQIKYCRTLPANMQAVMLADVEKLDVEYDEIWIWEDEEGLTPAEKRKWRGRNNINKLYWKQNKIQACTAEKFYISDPFTDQKLSRPSHKIWNVYSRNFILNKLQE